jgi:hypothetical protein
MAGVTGRKECVQAREQVAAVVTLRRLGIALVHLAQQLLQESLSDGSGGFGRVSAAAHVNVYRIPVAPGELAEGIAGARRFCRGVPHHHRPACGREAVVQSIWPRVHSAPFIKLRYPLVDTEFAGTDYLSWFTATE